MFLVNAYTLLVASKLYMVYMCNVMNDETWAPIPDVNTLLYDNTYQPLFRS